MLELPLARPRPQPRTLALALALVLALALNLALTLAQGGKAAAASAHPLLGRRRLSTHAEQGWIRPPLALALALAFALTLTLTRPGASFRTLLSASGLQQLHARGLLDKAEYEASLPALHPTLALSLILTLTLTPDPNSDPHPNPDPTLTLTRRCETRSYRHRGGSWWFSSGSWRASHRRARPRPP